MKVSSLKNLSNNIFSDNFITLESLEDIKNILKILEKFQVVLIGEDHDSSFHKEIEAKLIKEYKPVKVLIEGLRYKRINWEDMEKIIEIMNYICERIKIIEKIYTFRNIFENIFQDIQHEFKGEIYKSIILNLKNYIVESILEFGKRKKMNENEIWDFSILNLSNNSLNNFINELKNFVSSKISNVGEEEKILYKNLFNYVENFLKELISEPKFFEFKYQNYICKFEMPQKYVFEAAKEINSEIISLEDDETLVRMDKDIRILLWRFSSQQYFEEKRNILELQKLIEKLEEINRKREEIMSNHIKKVLECIEEKNIRKIVVICGRYHIKRILKYLQENKINAIGIYLPIEPLEEERVEKYMEYLELENRYLKILK